MRYGIGVDLGGTNIKIVAVSAEGQMLESSTCETQTDSPLSWVESVYKLAAGITSIINAFDPEVIIIGGGIAQAGPALFDPLERFLERLEWRPPGQSVRIVPAALGDFAGTLGAAYYAMSYGAKN